MMVGVVVVVVIDGSARMSRSVDEAGKTPGDRRDGRAHRRKGFHRQSCLLL